MAKHPFNDSHKEIVDKALKDLHEARQLMEHGEACGMDCSHDRSIADYLEPGLEEYRKRFFATSKQIPGSE